MVFTPEYKVKIANHVVSQTLDGEEVILNLESRRYYGLNPLGTKVWKLIQAKTKFKDMLALIVSEYEVSESTCRRDLLILLNKLREKDLVEIAPRLDRSSTL